ncbi:hypothetical protein EBU99_00505 [bacterium]|nr:hypothetical protein [bacterium]
MPSRIVDIGKTNNLVVVSDIHLREPNDERTQIFCRFLETLNECDTLVLLGDVFDFLNARQRFYHDLWSEVFSRLSALLSRGVKVVFVEGNHDYGFEHNPCSEIKNSFTVCGDFVAKVSHPAVGDIILLHSDDVVCPPSYLWFRGLVKSNLFQTLLSPVPGFVTSFIFSRYARLSRSKDKYRTLSGEFMRMCVEQFLRTELPNITANAKICVFGHIHVHLDEHFNDVRFLSGPDWFTAPNVMKLASDGRLERIWLSESKRVPEKFTFAPAAQTGSLPQA